MKSITVVLRYTPAPFFEGLADRLSKLPSVARVLVVDPEGAVTGGNRKWFVLAGSINEERTLDKIFGMVETSHLLFILSDCDFMVGPSELAILMKNAEVQGAGIVYADFYEGSEGNRSLHPVNDYQAGSVREGFDFGPMALLSVDAIRESRARYGTVSDLGFAGFYDLRLKLSINHPFCHIPEPLCTVSSEGGPLRGERLFSYVDPRNTEAQREMEQVFTDHVRRIGAYLPPSGLKGFEPGNISFPREASVIIPVKNRRETVGDAAGSALAQKTDFPFNVIVVDNHSTDGTTEVLARLAARNSGLKHLVPVETDLGIGGCWNAAIDSEVCGRYAIQLDSDDLYGDRTSLQRIVDLFRRANYAAVIGSYTLVDSNLKEVYPGLVDHREWTDDNGHNNALRVNGLGAPRAFNTALIRRVRFSNVSYGEDYSAVLRICREYRIGRIFDSLYLCRRWTGNTDSLLTVEEANRHDAYKDSIRTDEIAARQKKNREEKRGDL